MFFSSRVKVFFIIKTVKAEISVKLIPVTRRLVIMFVNAGIVLISVATCPKLPQYLLLLLLLTDYALAFVKKFKL